MSKPQIQSNPKVQQIFEDLEKFKDFCVNYGYKYDESNLYDMRSYTYQQFNKFVSHKNYKDQWAEDTKKMNNQVIFTD